ncbi:glycine--tRNA ligase subunit beta [Desulfopila aestuarii]|uniref:Glycine--tRNA ligase beta subunit n=1 Tax=Desulfopila aestuarii DSM 18488 TaxID=1121416 RepID=A0A1M7Y1E5_9BACT|nr:glycine--tRNA ligase subunit beta [Desulfopila aestuarii]SHO45622.1 glycyl-tRNA synthetase beta chain [Desulfopila aestuarii DSM 18488]
MRDLLYEIGTEEIPAGFIQPALKQLQEKFIGKAAELKIQHGKIEVKGTPRRLAILVQGVAEKQDDIREELIGPSAQAGIDADGNFTKAAAGFARSRGAEVSDLKKVETEKGPYLMLVREMAGKDTSTLLPNLLKELLFELSFPKSMKWGANHHSFARPIQWLLALFGQDIVDLEHDGIVSSNTSRGHRFLANTTFTVQDATVYEELLKKHFVVADIAIRRAMVVEEIKKAVAESALHGDASVAVDEDLVDLVTNLVEMPFGVCGRFDEKFLQVPDEVLITSMREHQKYFPVINNKAELLPGFVAVNNTRVKDPDITRKGHQRVLRARLEDALFFYKKDCDSSLEEKRTRLDGIIFQAKLGTMQEKVDRLVKLSRILAEKIAPEKVDLASRAAHLCKADLISDMVGEFPTLQGVMGASYAENDKEPTEVALAIQEHYMPKRAGADLPSSTVGAIVALADRFDTIAGCFGIGQKVTGTADPFGLRRLSLAVLNILADGGWDISIQEIVHKALALYGNKVDGSSKTVATIVHFIQGRFVNDCVAKGIEQGVVEAVTSVEFDNVKDALDRIGALQAIRNDQAFEVLASSYKRIRNIIKDNSDTTVSPELFNEEAERALYVMFQEVQSEMTALLNEQKYGEALKAMLKMKQPVDGFFDSVMVMADDAAVRTNRLNLLTAIGELILKIGDISKIG